MAVRQKLIAKNKLISGAQYTYFGSQIQNNRKKNCCLGCLGAKAKILLKINSFHFRKIFVLYKYSCLPTSTIYPACSPSKTSANTHPLVVLSSCLQTARTTGDGRELAEDELKHRWALTLSLLQIWVDFGEQADTRHTLLLEFTPWHPPRCQV